MSGNSSFIVVNASTDSVTGSAAVPGTSPNLPVGTVVFGGPKALVYVTTENERLYGTSLDGDCSQVGPAPPPLWSDPYVWALVVITVVVVAVVAVMLMSRPMTPPPGPRQGPTPP